MPPHKRNNMRNSQNHRKNSYNRPRQNISRRTDNRSLAPLHRRIENEFPSIHIRRESMACRHGNHPPNNIRTTILLNRTLQKHRNRKKTPKTSSLSIRNRFHDHSYYACVSTILTPETSFPDSKNSGDPN